jgi:hypothetical protein
MSRPSTGTTNTMWLTVRKDAGCERRTWRDYGCEIALTPCRLIDKRSHSREGTTCTTTWRPNSGWSLKILPIVALDSSLWANAERCPRDLRRSARLSSGIRGSWFLSCQPVSGTPASRLPLPSKQTAPGHRCYEGRSFWPVHELLPSKSSMSLLTDIETFVGTAAPLMRQRNTRIPVSSAMAARVLWRSARPQRMIQTQDFGIRNITCMAKPLHTRNTRT